jgi:WD40 repeat protein
MKSPFKFLDSYTKDDRDIFFGRDREIEELYQKVFESKMMLVYGVSGTGKSSLIHCGLANKFQETDWLPLIVRRGGNIIESTGSVIKAASITPQDGQCVTPVQFKKAVRSLYLDHYKPVFFIFDQFEELFIFGDKDERKSFVQIIKTLVESDLQCRLIFVMREEYMAGVTEFERYIPTFFANRVRIEKMSHTNAIEAINGPCKSADITLEDGFSEALLERLCPEGADVELTYLQVFLDRIFRLATSISPPSERAQGVSFTVSLLSRSGNVSDLLGRFLDEQIALLSNPDTALAVLKSFVSVRGTKRPMRTDDVKEYARTLGKSIEESELLEMVQIFIHLRILRDKDQDNRFELRHDALATKIYEKITLVEKEVLEIRQFVENAFANYEKRKIFLEPDDLNYIAPYTDKLFVNKKLNEFIENSRKNITSKKRAFNRILRFSAIGFVVIILSIVLFYFRSTISAKSEELTMEAFLQNEFSPALSFNTAFNAYLKDTTSTIAIKAMFDAFYALLDNGPYHDSLGNVIDPQKAIFNFTPCNSRISYARFSKDGKYIYGYLDNNTINIWDITGKCVFSQKVTASPVVALSFATNNKSIAAVYNDSTGIVWNIDGKIICETEVVFDPLNPNNVINFHPEKNIIAILKGNNNITIFNPDDSSSYELKGHTGEVNGAIFSPDGKFIASASKDSSIIIWQRNDRSGYFDKVNQIKGFNSIVWSVDFSGNSKYVLSFSGYNENSKTPSFPLNINKLSGERVFETFFWRPVSDSAMAALYPWGHYGEYFSACFTANNAAIRISTFNSILKRTAKNNPQTSIKSKGYDYHRLIYSSQSLSSLTRSSKYLSWYGFDSKKHIIDEAQKYSYSYSFVDASAKYSANNISGNDFSILFNVDELPIKKFAGIQPLFSPDGNYLLCLDRETLKLYPAEEKELIRLTLEKSIFGKLNTDPTKWRHFFKLQ